MWMRQLMHGHGCSRRTIVSEEFAIRLVITREIIHVYQISRNLDHILELRSCTPEDVADILDHRSRLHPDVEPGCTQGIDFGTGNRIVGTARAGSGHKQKVAGSLDVRILAARRRFSINDSAFYPAHLNYFARTQRSQPNADIVEFGVEIQ